MSDILDLEPSLRELVLQCEITGKKSVFSRNDRNIAVLISWDEYLSLKETIEISSDPASMKDLQDAEEQASRGALLLAEDLDGQ